MPEMPSPQPPTYCKCVHMCIYMFIELFIYLHKMVISRLLKRDEAEKPSEFLQNRQRLVQLLLG